MTARPGHGTTASGGMLVGRIGRAVIAEVIERAASADYETWWGRVGHAGYCAAPIRLVRHDRRGGQVQTLARCKNRRASVCPSCSTLYSGDTWQLVHRGIATAATDDDGARPVVFATLTAPSFGAVHTASHRGESATRCHPAARHQYCDHGRPAWCSAVHTSDDPRLGEPLCPDCYDYQAHVLFTWHAPGLWHRFTIGLRRLVRRRLREGGEEPDSVRVSYVKIVELQRRGVPHFHAVIRLDAAGAEAADSPLPAAPDRSVTTAELAVLVHRAAAAAHLEGAGTGGELVSLRFGEQVDVQPLQLADTGGSDAVERRVAGYLAKYVTKSVDEFGLAPHRLSPEAVELLNLRPHVRAILQTIIALAEDPGPPEMTRWLHALGYRGHITTKTRRYSTTMGALRAQRASWRGHTDAAQEPEVAEWVFAGSGHANHGERLLAASAAQRAAEQRRAAREALRDQPDEQP